jgi:hypothetical protein
MVSEASLEYTVKVVNAGKANEALIKALEMSALKIWIKGKDARVDFENPLRTQRVYFNSTTNHITLLREAGEDRYQWNLTEEDWSTLQSRYRDASFVEGSEAKDLNGYLTQKAAIIGTDSSTTSLFFTRQIQLLNKSFDPVFALTPGLPVSYTIPFEGTDIEFFLKKFETLPVPLSIFEAPKSGYKILKAPIKEP